MRARRAWVEPIGEILRLLRNQTVLKLHDAHHVRWTAVVSQYEFGDPEIAEADHPSDCETLLVRLNGTTLLDVMPATDSLARLGVKQHRILAVNLMLNREVIGV